MKRITVKNLIEGITSYLNNKFPQNASRNSLFATLNELTIILKHSLGHEQNKQDLMLEYEIARGFLQHLKDMGYTFYYKTLKTITEDYYRVEKVTPYLEGKYYSIHGQHLYIYVNDPQNMVDFNIFPDNLNFFDSESAWQISGRMAILRGILNESVHKAESILNINGFKKWDHPEETLINYYNLGDFSVFM